MKKYFVFLCILLSCVLCLSCAKKKKIVSEQAKKEIVSENSTLLVRHYTFTPNDPETTAFHFLEKLKVTGERISKFPADVALGIVDGEYIPPLQDIGTVTAVVQGTGKLKNGLVVPLEVIEWKKELHRGTTPKRDERGTGFSVRFEAEKKDGTYSLVSSLWYSKINGSVWASETNSLIAQDANVPKTISLLATEMTESQTTVFAVASPKKSCFAVITVSLVWGNPKDDMVISDKQNVEVKK